MWLRDIISSLKWGCNFSVLKGFDIVESLISDIKVRSLKCINIECVARLVKQELQ